MTNPVEARDTLEALAADRANLSRTITTPPSRHLAYSGLSGFMIASAGFAMPVNIAMAAVGLAGLFAVYRWDLRRDGAFVNGYRAGPTRTLTAGLVVVTLVLLAVGSWGRHHGESWPAIAAGLAFVPIGYAASVRWMTIYRRSLTR